MRRVQGIVGLSLFGCVCAVHSLGCFFTYDLDREDCDTYSNARCAIGADGGTPSRCVPSENSKPVADDCGIFISSSLGKDSNNGTKSAPVQTLQHALDKA